MMAMSLSTFVGHIVHAVSTYVQPGHDPDQDAAHELLTDAWPLHLIDAFAVAESWYRTVERQTVFGKIFWGAPHLDARQLETTDADRDLKVLDSMLLDALIRLQQTRTMDLSRSPNVLGPCHTTFSFWVLLAVLASLMARSNGAALYTRRARQHTTKKFDDVANVAWKVLQWFIKESGSNSALIFDENRHYFATIVVPNIRCALRDQVPRPVERIRQLKTDAESMQREAQQLKHEVESLKKEIVQQKSRCAQVERDWQTRMVEQRTDADRHKAEAACLARAYTSATRQLQVERGQCEAMKMSLDDALQQSQRQVADLDRDVSASRDALQAARVEIGQRNRDCDRHMADLHNALEQNMTLVFADAGLMPIALNARALEHAAPTLHCDMAMPLRNALAECSTQFDCDMAVCNLATQIFSRCARDFQRTVKKVHAVYISEVMRTAKSLARAQLCMPAGRRQRRTISRIVVLYDELRAHGFGFRHGGACHDMFDDVQDDQANGTTRIVDYCACPLAFRMLLMAINGFKMVQYVADAGDTAMFEIVAPGGPPYRQLWPAFVLPVSGATVKGLIEPTPRPIVNGQ